jgi:hypothetical protein
MSRFEWKNLLEEMPEARETMGCGFVDKKLGRWMLLDLIMLGNFGWSRSWLLVYFAFITEVFPEFEPMGFLEGFLDPSVISEVRETTTAGKKTWNSTGLFDCGGGFQKGPKQLATVLLMPRIRGVSAGDGYCCCEDLG